MGLLYKKKYLNILLCLPVLLGAQFLWALDADNDTLPDTFETDNGRDPLVPDYLISAGWNTTCGKDDSAINTADGEGRNKIFVNESFNNSATFYTNSYGGTNPVNPGYGYEKRGNGN